MPRPESDFDALRDDLRQVYDGDPWHGSSITVVLKGVDAKTAARRTIPNGHTIWELVLHMAGWTREVASRVRGNDAGDPAEDWPAQPKNPTEAEWRTAQKDLRAAHEDLVRAVDSLKPSDLVRMVGDNRDPSLGSGKTVGSHIRGLLQHHTYHEGQIAILKKAAG
ncbi:MAG TPA: DinB family protein [Gemmatimonadaceae bacterium]|nr:DinB family protein [Gemmatimonadaceae bacterium]